MFSQEQQKWEEPVATCSWEQQRWEEPVAMYSLEV